MALFDMDFVSKNENVIFLGPPGMCKTHLAISGHQGVLHGFKVYFTTMDTLMRKLEERQSRNKAYLTSTLVNKCFGDWQETFAKELLGGLCAP